MPVELKKMQRRQALFDQFLARPRDAPQAGQPAGEIADRRATGVGQLDAAFLRAEQVMALLFQAGGQASACS
jgi:hypothetical protein